MMALLMNWKLMLGLGLAIAAFGGGYKVAAWRYGADISDMLHEAAVAQTVAIKKNRELEQLGLDLMGVISERDAARNKERKVVERIVTKKVIEYVKSPDAGKCDVSPTFMRVHDAAASGGGVPETPDTTPPVDVAPRAITDVELIQVVVDNYEICHANHGQLVSLQEWVTASRLIGVN